MSIIQSAAVTLALSLFPAHSATPLPTRALTGGEVSDAVGDSGPAPDIATIGLEHTNAGKVKWTVKFANRTTFLSPDFLQIFIDADLRADTGQDGFEWAIQAAFPLDNGLFQWDGSAYRKVNADLVFTTAPDGSVTAEVDFRKFDSETLRFWLYADTEPVESDRFADEAPDGSATYLYQTFVPLLLDSFVPPKTMKAGKPLSVNLSVWTDDAVSPAISCRARLGRRALAGRSAWTPTEVPSPEPAFPGPLSEKGSASCRFAVPRNARGKTMTVTMVLSKEGETVRKVISKKIR
jgi:hypothetical protein